MRQDRTSGNGLGETGSVWSWKSASVIACAFLFVGAILVLLMGPGLSSLWGDLAEDIHGHQTAFYGAAEEALNAVRSQGLAAGGTLILLSFLYGVIHAAGPGHGKVVISTYLLSHESAVRRGIILSFLAALVQGITAVLLVETVVTLVDMTLAEANAAGWVLERISYGLITGVGIWLVWRAIFMLVRRTQTARHSRHHSHGSHAHGSQGTNSQGPNSHSHGEGCGHTHGPSADQMERPLSWRTALAVILSVGLRPCSGAIVVLAVAISLDLHLAGIAAVFAMSMGTALAVSALAVLAVSSRSLAVRFAGQRMAMIGVLGDGLALAAGLVIAFFGLVLLSGSLQHGHMVAL